MKIWILCFVLCFSFTSIRQDSFKETRQMILPPCYSSFEDLYFQGDLRMFVAIGKSVDFSKAVYQNEKRGFIFTNVPKSPFHKNIKQVPGLSLIVLERAATHYINSHFFHFLEHLIGLWNFGGQQNREDVKLFLFASNGNLKPPNNWKGFNNVTEHLIRALFPNAEIMHWGDLVLESGREAIHFEKVLISDRCMEYYRREPYHTERMLGEYYQYLSTESLDQLASEVHAYAQVEKKKTDKLVVTYVRRPPPLARSFHPEVERELVEKIEQLSGVELRTVDFAKLSFQQQVDAAFNTDVLLGIHGNGLSHTLFLPKGATLIELFPKDCLNVEYRIFAGARGLGYHGMIAGQGWIDEPTAHQLGAFGNNNKQIDAIDVDAIVSVIQQLEARR